MQSLKPLYTGSYSNYFLVKNETKKAIAGKDISFDIFNNCKIRGARFFFSKEELIFI